MRNEKLKIPLYGIPKKDPFHFELKLKSRFSIHQSKKKFNRNSQKNKVRKEFTLESE
jgi:hypothetical protein